MPLPIMAEKNDFREESKTMERGMGVFRSAVSGLMSMNIRHLFTVDLNLSGRVFGLDIVRAVAILQVVQIHGIGIMKPAFPNYEATTIVDGVDLFFVLSGFLIGQILLRGFLQDNYTMTYVFNFWKRRWMRTLPNYYLVLLLSLLYASCTHYGIGDFNFKYFLFLQNFASPHPTFFPVAWSLSVEEWFYILCPILLLLFHKVFRRLDKSQVFLMIIIAFIALPMCYRLWSFLEQGIPQGYSTYDRLSEGFVIKRLDAIMFGVLGVHLKMYAPKIWNAAPKVCFVIGVSVLYSAYHFGINPLIGDVFGHTIKACGILMLFPLLDSIKQGWRFLVFPITLVSIISYSMYLIHYSLVLAPVMFMKNHSQSLGILAMGETVQAVVLYCLYWAGTLLGSVVLYNIFEKPMLDLRKSISSSL